MTRRKGIEKGEGKAGKGKGGKKVETPLQQFLSTAPMCIGNLWPNASHTNTMCH